MVPLLFELQLVPLLLVLQLVSLLLVLLLVSLLLELKLVPLLLVLQLVSLLLDLQLVVMAKLGLQNCQFEMTLSHIRTFSLFCQQKIILKNMQSKFTQGLHDCVFWCCFMFIFTNWIYRSLCKTKKPLCHVVPVENQLAVSWCIIPH